MSAKERRPEQHPSWRGGRYITDRGYVAVFASGRDAKVARRYIYEHVLVAEKALGKPLPKGSIVHHVNGDTTDNRPENLVVCQDLAHHMRIHLRQRALEACGHADWRKCIYCDVWSPPSELKIRRTAYHRACEAARHRELRAAKNYAGNGRA